MSSAPLSRTPPVRPAAARGAGAIVLAGLLLTACGSEEDPATGTTYESHGASLLLVTIDTTRADRIGCYGRPDAGTPHLDALAERGARFARAYATAPITLPSHTSILTGSYPPYHGIRDNGLFVLNERVETLAETCRRAGYRTGAFVSAFPLFGAFGLAQGFEVYDDRFEPTDPGVPGYMKERPAGDTVRSASTWLDSLAPDERFFAWVHFFDPHDPLQAPAPFAERFPDDPYQAEIAYADAELGQLLATLERLGRTATTLVAVTSDHGESLGDHGEEKHAILLYDSTMHVPLIVAGPGVPTLVVDEAVSLVDVAPTLVDLAGIDDGGTFSSHEGHSLAPVLFDGATLQPRDLYLETYFPRMHHGWSELVGIAREDWKYVEAPGETNEEGRARGELFRPASDTAELRELSGEHADEAQRLAARLAELRHRLEQDSLAAERRAPEDGDLERLAELGYGGLDVLAEAPTAAAQAPPGRDPRAVVEATTYLNRVRSYAFAGYFDRAQADLAELVRIDPQGVIRHEAEGDLYLARARAGNAGAYERAAAAFAAATELKPGRRGLWTRRSEALRNLGRLEEALVCIEQALALAPPTAALLEARDAIRRSLADETR